MTTHWTVHLDDAVMCKTFDDEHSAWEWAEQYSRLYLGEFSTSYRYTIISTPNTTPEQVDWTKAIEQQMRRERAFGRQLA